MEVDVSGRTVREAIEELGLEPEAYLAFEKGRPLPDDAPAPGEMELLKVVVGG